MSKRRTQNNIHKALGTREICWQHKEGKEEKTK